MQNQKDKISFGDVLFVATMALVLVFHKLVAVKAALILAFFAFMLFLNFSRSKRAINKLQVAWLVSFTSFAYLSQYWAYKPEAIYEVINNVIWGALLCVSTSLYVVVYDMNVNKISKRILFISLFFIANAMVNGTYDGDGRISADNNSNLFGRIAVLLFIFLFLQSKKYAWKNIIYNAATLALALFTFLSGSRTWAMMLILYSLAYMFLEEYSKDIIRSCGKIFAIACVGVVAYLCVLNVGFLYDTVGYRVETLVSGLSGETTDGSTATRLIMIEEAKELFWRRPLCGNGLNNFAYCSSFDVYAHNNYYELASGVGIIGLLLYYVPLVMFLTRALKSWLAKAPETIVPLSALASGFLIDIGSIGYLNMSNYLLQGFAVGMLCNTKVFFTEGVMLNQR